MRGYRYKFRLRALSKVSDLWVDEAQLSSHWLCILLYSFLYSRWIKDKWDYPKLRWDGKFSLMTRNPPFHSILIIHSPLEAERGDGGGSSLTAPPSTPVTLRAKVLSHLPSPHDVPSVQGHLSSSFPVYCLKTGKWLAEQRQFPQGQAVCNTNKYSSQCLSNAIVNHLSLLPSNGSVILLAPNVHLLCQASAAFSYCLGRQLSLSPLSALLCLVFLK